MADEIEVTEEMVEAGYAALEAACITDDLLGADRLTVAKIYRAMEAKRDKSVNKLLTQGMIKAATNALQRHAYDEWEKGYYGPDIAERICRVVLFHL